ncbi:MAG: hypothetical protein ACTHZI_03335 [Luteimonas sp.]
MDAYEAMIAVCFALHLDRASSSTAKAGDAKPLFSRCFLHGHVQTCFSAPGTRKQCVLADASRSGIHACGCRPVINAC